MVYLVWYYCYDSELDDFEVDLEDVFESYELAEATVLDRNPVETYTWVKGEYSKVYSRTPRRPGCGQVFERQFWVIEEREVVRA